MHKWVIAASLAFLSASQAGALSQDVYVWQRVWTPALKAALSNSLELFGERRVLAAETTLDGHLRPFAIEWAALATKPVTGVVRIDGTLARFDRKRLIADIRRLTAAWPKQAGLEIDFDCGSARLADYTRFLTELHAAIPRRISITVLPAWLDAPNLPAVLAASDETVLQVHAVRSPAQGLFDPKLARRWIDRFDRITNKPFRVALPDYGTRIIRGAGGAVVAMESESPKLVSGASAEELLAEPQNVAPLVGDLMRNPPKHFAGLVWFRLPVAGDKRIWSLETLKLVMRGEAPKHNLTLEAQPGSVPGAVDIMLINRGATDLTLPAEISLPRACHVADGIGAYRYEAQKNQLLRLQNAFIPGHHGLVIGWARCAPGDFHAEP
ncbi:hypothetical protein FHS83_001733 [Rhizomicrobium palustre]|uniref:DUF3142 domain-containing protein n=1 Tax=Rhizomicrobium palustre TaxID=189966 RepID=A0A846MYW9_9PROT|nr:DUF3142 domain-containing protein [Rhizomicrobium palustre]NIK88415.1 hypothetical protein [Rhizomicrobium palustre]